MIEPKAEECKKCHFNVHEKCYRCCEHIKSEFARIEKENKELKQAMEVIVHKTNHSSYSEEDANMMIHEACNVAKRALKNAKS